MCYYGCSDIWLFVTVTVNIIGSNTNAVDWTNNDRTSKNISFKDCRSFTDSVEELTNTQIFNK